ncbi:MAG TPA: hypothetical protein VIB02_04330 [Candidatus Limnocylindrales bacterium]
MQTTQQRQLIDPRAIRNVSLIALVFAVGTALGTMIDIDPTAVSGPASVPIGDRSYDAVEETRADRGLSVPAGDRSYDAVEETRADRGLSVPAGDHSYDAVEETRADRGLD